MSINMPVINVVTAVKICAYRFVQEGLANAFRHAGGKDQTVSCGLDGQRLTLLVSDGGVAAFSFTEDEQQSGLGLEGLRLRVESIGGTLTFRNSTKAAAKSK